MTELNSTINSALSETLTTTRLENISPQGKELDRALSMSGKELTNLSSDKLSELLFTLTNHICYVQLRYNVQHVWYIQAKDQYEKALNKAFTEFPEKMTIKDKTARALEKDNIKELYDALKIKESQFLLLNKMPEVLTELCNAIKKEISRRTPNGK